MGRDGRGGECLSLSLAPPARRQAGGDRRECGQQRGRKEECNSARCNPSSARQTGWGDAGTRGLCNAGTGLLDEVVVHRRAPASFPWVCVRRLRFANPGVHWQIATTTRTAARLYREILVFFFWFFWLFLLHPATSNARNVRFAERRSFWPWKFVAEYRVWAECNARNSLLR